MIYLLDTHLLLWSSYEPHLLSVAARQLLSDPRNDFAFSSASIWEVAIKAAKHPDTFLVDPVELRDGLIDLGYREVDVTSSHAALIPRLPLLHHDPFDRMLVVQAQAEGFALATVDSEIRRYSYRHIVDVS